MLKKLFYQLFSCIIFLSFYAASAQYTTKHYIAPAPWQYWSNSNEIVIGTLSTTPVQVTLRKSDGTLITDALTVVVNAPISYRFVGSSFIQRNEVNQLYNDRGLIVEATAPVLVNLRNIDSDTGANSVTYIKGNASLVSFGDEGKGLEFRVGYYRISTMGLTNTAPVYSVMATENGTTVNLPAGPVILNEGQSRLFYANIGYLVTADKPVVMNTGNWGDTPWTATPPSNGQDGTFDQIAPVHVLGTQYLVVRGSGDVTTATQQSLNYGGEQTTIVTTEDNTSIVITNFTQAGAFVNTTTQVVPLAGGNYTFYHGNAINQYSSSLIVSDKRVIVYSGTAVGAETDISTVLPIGGCSGITNIQTKKFISYNNTNLPYFGFTVIEHPTEPVLLNGTNLETLTGIPRIQLGTTPFYMLTFQNTNVGNPADLILTSDMPLTTSIVQSGDGFSMAAFFSAFGQAAIAPVLVTTNDDCTVTIEAENGEDILEYEWFKDGVSVAVTDDNVYEALASGNYTVSIRKNCGWSNQSLPTFVEVDPCNDLSIEKTIKDQTLNQVTFVITVKNNDLNFTDNAVVVNDVLPSGYTYVSYTATQGTYDNASGNWSVGTLAPGDSATIEILVNINENGVYLNTANVTGENIDKNPDNNTDTAIIELGRLKLTKRAEKPIYYQVGDVIDYELTLTNTGTAAVQNINITDPNADPGSIIPNYVALLMPNQSITASAKHTITVTDFLAGEVSNQALANSSTPVGDVGTVSDDPDTPFINDPTIVKIERTADLDGNKDDGVLYYENEKDLNYVIVVKNNGPSSAVDVIVSDPMPAGITEMSWQSSRSTSGTGNLYDVIPLLKVGETVTYNVKLTVPKSFKGDLVNIVDISSESNEDPVPNCTACVDIDRQTVVIPKGISPNGDGLNDFLDLKAFHVAKITIHNRYGKEVYSRSPYSQEWNGQNSNGDPLPDGTYFYHIIVDGGFIYTGYIQLTREVK